jgi:formylglycine-generating enzyme required for sulfatase activity
VEAPSPLAARAYLRASRVHRRLRGLASATVLVIAAGFRGSYYLHVTRELDLHTQWAWLALQVGWVFEPEMKRLEGGRFRMGCLSGENCPSRELPVREVTVEPFWIGRYEVTFAE